MAHLLLFAAIREAAGIDRVDIEGCSTKEVINRASQRFGADFAALLPYCKTYVKGEPVDGDVEINGDDEVALLPPVSGGCE